MDLNAVSTFILIYACTHQHRPLRDCRERQLWLDQQKRARFGFQVTPRSCGTITSRVYVFSHERLEAIKQNNQPQRQYEWILRDRVGAGWHSPSPPIIIPTGVPKVATDF